MPDKTCFVLAPIGEPDTDIRKRSDQVFKHIIAPAVEECGYSPLRADHISEPGLISSQVIQHIVNDPLVVADLTGRNPNVFYELAIRHALRKPLVQIIKSGEQIPFDVAGTRTIYVDHRDLDSVETAKGEIVKQVKAVEKNLRMLRRRSLFQLTYKISNKAKIPNSGHSVIYSRLLPRSELDWQMSRSV